NKTWLARTARTLRDGGGEAGSARRGLGRNRRRLFRSATLFVRPGAEHPQRRPVACRQTARGIDIGSADAPSEGRKCITLKGPILCHGLDTHPERRSTPRWTPLQRA